MKRPRKPIEKFDILKKDQTTFGHDKVIVEVFRADTTCPVPATGLIVLRLLTDINKFYFYSEQKECMLNVDKDKISFNEYSIAASDKEGFLLVNEQQLPVLFPEFGYIYDYSEGSFEFSYG